MILQRASFLLQLPLVKKSLGQQSSITGFIKPRLGNYFENEGCAALNKK